MSHFPNAKQLFTTVTEDGKSILSIEPYVVPEPKEHEVVVQMEAVPINPSDLGLLTAAANMDTVRSETVDGHPALVADVDPVMQPFFKGRAGKKLAAGNEGAGYCCRNWIIRCSTSVDGQDRHHRRRRNVSHPPRDARK